MDSSLRLTRRSRMPEAPSGSIEYSPGCHSITPKYAGSADARRLHNASESGCHNPISFLSFTPSSGLSLTKFLFCFCGKHLQIVVAQDAERKGNGSVDTVRNNVAQTLQNSSICGRYKASEVAGKSIRKQPVALVDRKRRREARAACRAQV